jgi:diguanylate cyclase
MKKQQKMTDLPDLRLLDFESASRAVLDFLYKRLGFGLWMVTRNVGNEWIILQTENHGYNIKRGDVFNWTDSLCSVMVRGEGPRMVPDSDQEPVYAQVPLHAQLPIKSYIGVPLLDSEGGIFGTLCALDPDPQSQTIVMEQPLIELLAALLSSILKLELNALEAQRRMEKLAFDAQIDPLTQLANRRAWDQLIPKEEERSLRYGHSAAIVMVGLDGLKLINESQGKAAGDALLQRTANALRDVTRAVDLVARLGGDEFGVFAVECNDDGTHVLLRRVRQILSEREIKASVGIAVRHETGGLNTAWKMAERRMYEEKRNR